MKPMRTKTILCIVLLALTLAFIWGNSLLDADHSGAISGAIWAWWENIKAFFSPSGAAQETGDHLLRKIAHGAEFTAFGAELFILFRHILRQSPVLPLFLGLLAALFDETIQLSSAGRSSQVTDVWIDFGGVAAGAVLVILILILQKRLCQKRYPSKESGEHK